MELPFLRESYEQNFLAVIINIFIIIEYLHEEKERPSSGWVGLETCVYI